MSLMAHRIFHRQGNGWKSARDATAGVGSHSLRFLRSLFRTLNHIATIFNYT